MLVVLSQQTMFSSSVITVISFIALNLMKVEASSAVLEPLSVGVVEGKTAILTCTFTEYINKSCGWTSSLFIGNSYTSCNSTLGFLSNPNVSVSCPSSLSYRLELNNVPRLWHGAVWQCFKPGVYSLNATMIVQVPITSASVTRPNQNTVTLSENTTGIFTCETSVGRPAAQVKWYKQKESYGAIYINNNFNITELPQDVIDKTISYLQFRPTRADNDSVIFCAAFNIDGQSEIISDNKPRLNVTYPPDGAPKIQGDGNLIMIEHKNSQLVCSITGGNPVPKLTWTCTRGTIIDSFENYLGTTLTKTANFTSGSGDNIRCDCSSSFNNDKDSVNIEIQYPPKELTFQAGALKILDNVNIIQNNSLAVKCSALGNPQPTITWKTPNHTTIGSSELNLANIQRNANGKYICQAENILKPTDGPYPTGLNNASIMVQVLYNPKIEPISNQVVIEGNTLSVNCNFTPGYPTETRFKWTRTLDNTEWQYQELKIFTVSRNDSTFYTCNASNTMIQTVGQNQTGTDKQTFFLNVLYKASILTFTLNNETGTLTVTENQSVTMACTVDSNPGSTVQVKRATDNKVLKTEMNSKFLKHTISPVMCTDVGQYVCTGRNDHNTVQAERANTLLVRCSPRPDPNILLKENVTTSLRTSVLLQFNTLAYPIPQKYDWYKEVNVEWVLLNNSEETQISSVQLQSNLTIVNITVKFLGRYKLKVINDVGTGEQIFNVLAQDKPNKPTELEHLQERVTTSSLTVQWKTGFDGGLKQTFIMQYRKTGTERWYLLSVNDTVETPYAVINYTILNLDSGTQYEIMLYASNILGNSTPTVISAWTATEADKPPIEAALIGGVVGGSSALILVVVIAVFIIMRFKSNTDRSESKIKLSKKGEQKMEDSDEDEMVENKMYVSAGPVIYSKPTTKVDTRNTDVYAVVDKTKKKEDPKVKKENPRKKKKFAEGDVYENAPEKPTTVNNTYGNAAFEDNPYENPGGSQPSKTPKKNINPDGLIYADLAFNDQPKGQKKLVIHGLDEMTTYIQVDFNRKADPLPDSDTEEQSVNKKH